MAGKYLWSGLGETQNILNQNPEKIMVEGAQGEFYDLFLIRTNNAESITERYYIEAEVPYTQRNIMTYSGFSIQEADVELQLLFRQTIPLNFKGKKAIKAFTTGDIGEMIHKRYGWSNPRKENGAIIVSVNNEDFTL